MIRICTKCKTPKEETRENFSRNGASFRSECKCCETERLASYYKANKKQIKAKRAEYRNANLDKVRARESAYNAEYRKKNLNSLRTSEAEYRKKNPDKVKGCKARYHKANQVELCMRIQVWKQLRAAGYSLPASEVFEVLPYTLEELKKHLESQFEPWMGWDNHGKYNAKTWRDDDQSSWVWNIDHIAPRSSFNPSGPNDDHFQQCWALSNLRPYSAKQNILDSNRRKIQEGKA